MSVGGTRRLMELMLLAFFCYLVFVEWFFLFHGTGGVMRTLSTFVVIPAATAQQRWLSYKDVAKLEKGIRGFDEDIKKRDAFDRALRVGVSRLYVEKLARELDVKIAKDDLEAYPIDLAALQPSLDAAHWSEADYRKYIIEPLLLTEETERAVLYSSEYQAEARKSMDSLRKKLDQGMLFTDIAMHFSEDPSALSRGDMGIMSQDDVPDWLMPAMLLEPGEISGVLEAPDAFWTVQMIEYYPSTIGAAAVHFRGIAVKKTTLSEVTEEAFLAEPPFVFVW